MFHRIVIVLLLASGLLTGMAFAKKKTAKKAANPLADVSSKQPDKVLYDRAMKAMKQHKYDTARVTLQTMINAYPESEFLARAKLAVGETWYQEGTTAGLAQAENEFRDFITFFPNMPEAAEAQLKIADIHYRQMGKPDRDFSHARHAQDEYRLLLQQYPDSKLAETARLRLLEVQEVLAEREYRIARFYYYGRQSLLAAIARFKTLTDTYPLYSRADDAYFMLGQAYEQQAERTRISPLAENVRQRLISGYLDGAAQAYSKILTRYPAMPRADDARHRLASMKREAPTPTAEAIALNKKELASRTRTTRYERFVNDMGKHPDLSAAVHVGQPSLADPKETDAPYLVREITSAAGSTTAAGQGSGAIKVEAASGSATANQPPPSSPVAAVNPSDVPAQPPPQLNEAAGSAGSESAAASSSSSSTNIKEDPKQSSSSRKKKRRFPLHIPTPF